MNNNPWESDLDIDEDTGEVILPPGYTGRSGNPRAQAAARRRGVGQFDPGSQVVGPTTQRSLQPAPSGPEPATPPEPPPAPEPDAGGKLAPANGCPPCPPCGPAGGRMRSPRGSLLGLVIGIGTLGGVLWYAGRMASLGEAEEDLEQILDALPSRGPKLSKGDPLAGDDEAE